MDVEPICLGGMAIRILIFQICTPEDVLLLQTLEGHITDREIVP